MVLNTSKTNTKCIKTIYSLFDGTNTIIQNSILSTSHKDTNCSISDEYLTIKKNYWKHHPPRLIATDEVEICNCSIKTSFHHQLTVMICTNSHTCENVAMHITCDERKCKQKYCQNKAFHLRPLPKFSIFQTDHCGTGVRINVPKNKGDFIIEYVGEVIGKCEMKKRLSATSKNETNFYIMELSNGKYIDARKMGNISRYINSSCSPNCELQKWIDSSTNTIQIGIFAIRNIEANEEITFNYNFFHYGKKKITLFECKCKSKNCIGTLDKRYQNLVKSQNI